MLAQSNCIIRFVISIQLFSETKNVYIPIFSFYSLQLFKILTFVVTLRSRWREYTQLILCEICCQLKLRGKVK